MSTFQQTQSEPPRQAKKNSGCLVLVIIAAVCGFFMLLCCAGLLILMTSSVESTGPFTTDEELLERFRAHRTEFDALLADPENPELLAALKLNKSWNDGDLHFEAWWEDIVFTGYRNKGYVYCEEAPSHLVDSTDQEALNETIYRHIDGKWYLFYHSTD